MAEAETNNSNNQNKKYRANRKKFFLTYSQCDKTPEELFVHLSTIAAIHKYLIAQELHQDGGKHLHAYIDFVEKQDFKNCRWADFDGYHPNDRGKVRDEFACAKYCGKDGNFITNFYKINPWSKAADPETTVDEAMEILRKERPEKFLLYRDQLYKNLKSQKKRKIEMKCPDIQLRVWQKAVLELLKQEPADRTVIWIYSEFSNMGKTTFKKYVQYHYKDDFLVGSATLRDTMYSYDGHKIIWFDLPRAQPIDAEMLAQLECLSDGGIINSSKYASGNKVVSAHIVVTTNKDPYRQNQWGITAEMKLPERLKVFHCVIEE